MLTKQMLLAASALLIAHAATAQTAPTPAQPSPNAPLTREAVQQDLDAWVKSGMAELTRREETPDTNSAEYQRRLARYHELRRQQPH